MGRMLRLLLIGALTLAGTTARSQSGDRAQPDDPPKTPRWEGDARKHGLEEKDLQLLRKNKFVITGASYKQVFEPYLGSRVPVFVTTDSLLNAFHVLFEESIFQLEQAHARKLPLILDHLGKHLGPAGKQFQGDARLLAAARKRAAVFLGTARQLLDTSALPDDPALRALIQEEVQRITAARETSKPAWLGVADDGFRALDYSRFQPRGFYTRSPALQRYFRAVSWLQAIPFRLDNDEEFAAFLLLRRAFSDPDQNRKAVGTELWRDFRRFLGSEDDWDLPSAEWLPREITREELDALREKYRAAARWGERPPINDQLRFLPDQTGGKPELAFRFLSAYRLPDAMLFQRTTGPELNRQYPSGLEVCAVLGSTYARGRLAKDSPKVVKEIDCAVPWFGEKSQYASYLRCLRVLLERTEPDAPGFFKEEAWKIKTCQTALSSWAQMRHTWALQAKQSAYYFGVGPGAPAGYVEPVPEFYGRLARLVEETRTLLEQAGALAAADDKEIVEAFEAAEKLLEKAKKDKKGLACLTAEELSLLARFDPQLNSYLDSPEEERKNSKALAETIFILGMIREVGRGGDAKALRQSIIICLGAQDVDLATEWTTLAHLCHRLEVMAHKQLRKVPFTVEENQVLLGYGKALAGVMLYGGNSYFTPRDDAPRVVDLFTNPSAKRHLLVGSARPRTLWVLYPIKGDEVLCRGAVLPYREFTHPQRLTDADWRTLLKSPQAPELPDWIRPITVTEPTSKKNKEK